MHKFLDLNGIFLILAYLVITFVLIWLISVFKYSKDPLTKKIFLFGFAFKIACGIGFALIYDFYYRWAGDTYYYYLASVRLGRVLFEDPKSYFLILCNLVSNSNYNDLAIGISYVPDFGDPSKYAIQRFLSPFAIIGGDNYYTISIVLCTFLYLINWKFLRYLDSKLECSNKVLFFSLVLMPSPGFWSSGLLKDAFTYSFNFLLIYSFARLFIERKLKPSYIIELLLSALIIKDLKVYILYATLASCMLWLGLIYLKRIKSTFIKVLAVPIISLAVIAGGLFVFKTVASSSSSAFQSVDAMLGKAAIAQYDLKQEYYEGHAFDIGDFDGTIGGMVKIAPAAIIAGIYRPFILECDSAVMYLSGMENLFLAILLIYVIIRVGFVNFFRKVFSEPFVCMCFVFVIVLALGIGISTSNFGALVRFKIPLIPFYLIGCFEVLSIARKEKAENLQSING